MSADTDAGEARLRRELLLVEDDAVDAELLRRALSTGSDRAFHIHHETNLAGARSWLDEHPVDLVVLDLSLPDSFGAYTYFAVRDIVPSLPIVVMTGDDDVEMARSLIHEGAQDYLVKGEIGAHHTVRCFEYAIERMHARQELEEARRSALEASRAKSAFVSAMSHEIRTPMNAILGMADLLRASELTPDQREYVEIFRRCGRSLLALLNNVLEFSKLESGNVEVARGEIDLVDLVEDCAEPFAFAAHRKGLSIASDLDEGVPERVMGDEPRLRQVIFNLLGNAIKFTDRGHVLLRVTREVGSGDGPRIRFEVQDTGKGIASDRVEAVFDRFVQEDEDISRNYGGSGLGLSLSAELVRLMGGSIGVESREGEGSVFAFSLPLEPAPSIPSPVVDLSGRRALVADDADAERELVARWLRRASAEVVESSCVEEAERLLQRESFDFAILDCRMPGGGGLDLAEAMWPGGPGETGPRIVVLLPMDHRASDPSRCRAIGARTLLKPARQAALMDALVSEEATDERPESDRSDLAGLRVLLAEDSADNRTLALAYLGPMGCEVDVAENGALAVNLWRDRRFDVVLMDMQMPEMDGAEATRWIRKQEDDLGQPRTPIIALTAYAFREQADRCLEAGCDAHVAKPFDKGQLVRAIRAAVGRSAPEIELEIPPDLADLAVPYLESRKSDLETLRNASARSDFEKVRVLGHNMKGSGAGYGFPDITRIGAALENAANGEDGEAIERETAELERYVGLAELAVGRSGVPSS